MNKLCFYTNDPKKIRLSYVQLYEIDENPEKQIDDLILTDTFYVFKKYPYIDRLMGYIEIIQNNKKIKKYNVDYDPLIPPTIQDGDSVTEFITYIKPIENTQEIFVYSDIDGHVFFTKQVIHSLKKESVLDYYPHTFFVLKNIENKFVFEQNACYLSTSGNLSLDECIQREKGTEPKILHFKPTPYKKLYRIITILFVAIIVFIASYKLFRSTFFTSPLLVNVPNK